MGEDRDETDRPDLEGLLEELRAKVEERRQSGAYPPGLEEDLEAHLRRVVGQRLTRERLSVRQQLEREIQIPSLEPARLSGALASVVPGGASVRNLVARLVNRQVGGLLAQVQALNDRLWEALVLVADATDEALGELDGASPSFAHLVAMVDAVVERMAAYERAPEATPAGVAELARRVERLEAVEAARTPRPWFSPELAGEGSGGLDVWRLGPVGLSPLVELLEGCDPVLDPACGAGQVVAALRRAGIEAEGVEASPVLVEQATAAGLPVREGRALETVEAWPDRSLGGVVSVGLVERLGAQELLDLVRAVPDKLKPGGRAVLLATNPRSLWGLANGTAGRPDRALVDPGWLSLCCREAGFASVEVVWGPGPGDDAELRSDGDPAPGIGAAARETPLERLVLAPPTYLLTATR